MATLLSLPIELRLQIFSEILTTQDWPPGPTPSSMNCAAKEYHNYEQTEADSSSRLIANARRPTLFFRNIDPLHYRQVATLTWPCWRTVYEIRCDRFRARILDTTYQCMNLWTFGNRLDLLLVNRQIHTETARMLYGGYTFDFDTHIEAIVPFLSDLTPFSRSCIKSLSFIKRALPYEKEYDRCEWSNAMHYLSNPKHGFSLQTLHIGIVAGRPGPDGWRDVPTHSAADFEYLVQTDSMSWLKDLIKIRGLQHIDAYAVVEHCPPGTNSSAMADYIKFSSSIECGLADFLKKHMLTT